MSRRGKGLGGAAGGVAGGVAGDYLGGPAGAQIGAMAGSTLGSMLDQGAGTPQQTPRQVSGFDPYQNFSGLGAIENAVMQNLGRGGGDIGNPYVGPNAQQQGALDLLQRFSEEATPTFQAGNRQLQATIGGRYLDPMQQAPFQRLSDARLNLARQLFGEFAPEYSSSAVAAGVPYSSSSREAGIQRGAERIGTQAAQDIAQAGWGQYGAERGYQEAATARGLGLAPGLAGQVFTGNETLRAAQQQGATAQLEAQLRAMGLGNDAINVALRYMQLRALQPYPSIVGPTPEQQWTARLNGLEPLVRGIGNIRWSSGGADTPIQPGGAPPWNPGGAEQY